MVTQPVCHVTVEAVKLRLAFSSRFSPPLDFPAYFLHLFVSEGIWNFVFCWRDTERAMHCYTISRMRIAWATKIQDGLSVVIFLAKQMCLLTMIDWSCGTD